jgi:hypothetical protein
VPLPYEIGVKSEAEAEPTEEEEGRHSQDLEAQRPGSVTLTPSTATGVDPARKASNAEQSLGSIRQRRKAGSHEASPLVRAITRVGTLLRASHAQDFERRRKSEVPHTLEGDDDDDDDDSDDDHGATVEGDERDGSYHRSQTKLNSDSEGNGKAPKQRESDEDDDEELVGSGSGSGGEGASSASDDQEIARAKVLSKER